MLIETPIDKLIELVKQKERVTLAEAGKALGVDEEKVEEWVRVLEDKDFVELIYPAIGEPVIILKKITDKVVDAKEKELGKQKEIIGKKAVQLEKTITVSEKKMEITNKNVSRLEKDLRGKLERVEGSIKVLDSLDSKKQEIIRDKKAIDEKAEETVRSIDSIKSTIDEIDKSIEEKIRDMESHESQIKDMEKLRKDIRDDIENLDAEIKLTKMIFRPAKPPLLGSLRGIFKKHGKKVDKIKDAHKKIHRKISAIKDKTEKKKDKIKSNDNYKEFW
jgi:chromosome segregation ATPase